MERDLTLQEFNDLYGESFCIKPFTEICNTARGGISLCCNSNSVLARPDKEGRSLVEIFKNDKQINEIRRKMLNGERVDACNKCLRFEEKLGHSMRMQVTNNMRSNNPTLTDSIHKTGEVKLLTLDIKFGNKCNLGCIMCDNSSSSLIGLERVKHKVPDELEYLWNTTAESDVLTDFPESELEELKALSSSIIRFKSTGGEPMLLPGLKNWIQYLVDNGKSQKMRFTLVTNNTVDATPMLHLMNQFKQFTMVWSIDAVDEDTLSYIRYPASFAKFKKHHKRVMKSIKENNYNNILINFSTVQHALSIHESMKVAAYADEIGINGVINFDVAAYPAPLLAGLVHPDTLAETLTYIDEYLATPGARHKPEAIKLRDQLAVQHEQLEADPERKQSLLHDLKRMTDYWERSRKLKASDYVSTFDKTMSQLK